jgi:5'(3')-deoxyribonucleotidase
MKNKQKLILDFDNTIVNSTKAFCNVYNLSYCFNKNWVKADWTLSNVYNFEDVCPLLEGKHEWVYPLFEHELFFKTLEFINENTKEVIEQVCKNYNVYICSIGTPKNLYLKSLWLQKHLPCIQQYVLLTNNGCKMDKSIVNMDDGWLLDDNNDNLMSSNAGCKISFGKRYSWNKNWTGWTCLDWNEVKNFLRIT